MDMSERAQGILFWFSMINSHAILSAEFIKIILHWNPIGELSYFMEWWYLLNWIGLTFIIHLHNLLADEDFLVCLWYLTVYITNKDVNVIGTELEIEMNHVMFIELLFKFKIRKTH